MQNYDVLIEKIVRSSGLEREEIEERVIAKKEKLSGLISKEGAAQIIAAEMGFSFDDESLKINELSGEMRKVNLVGKIVNMFPVREYNKNGRSGKVANLILADDTGNAKMVFWDVNHISLIENKEIVVGDVVEIKNASVRDMEVHLSGFSEIKKSSAKIDNAVTEYRREAKDKSLNEVNQGEQVRVRGVVVSLFPPRFYMVCPECNKKVNSEESGFSCVEHGKIVPKSRAILNFVIDDGSENMRVVMFSDSINKLISEEDLKDVEKVADFRDEFLGTEIYLSGNVKRNQLFNNLEIIASEVENVDVEKLIVELENKK